MFSYSELDCLSNLTFLRGASHPEELMHRAAQLGYRALAMSDECSVSGLVRAHQAARQHDIQLIVGSRFRIDEDELIVLVSEPEGYGNLCELITHARQRASKGHYQFYLNDILNPEPPLRHLQYLPGCLFVYKPAYDPDPVRLLAPLQTLAQALAQRIWLGLAMPHYHADARHRHHLQQLAQDINLPLVALGQVEMHRRSRQPLHDVLTAIRSKTPIDACGYALRPNAEHHLRSRWRLARLYPEQALKQTEVIRRRCHFSLEDLRYCYPQASVPKGMSSSDYLRQQTLAGAQWRYPQGVCTKVAKQIEDELALIAELGYETYFLTVYDIVRYARSKNILCQGRGSAANSVVCYCLGITEVDPASSNTLFARFMGRERNEPPDIDVDFEHHRREEVIQYIYQKYGQNRAALTAVVITYRRRSALRDTGKALGLDAALIDKVCVACRYWDVHSTLLERIQAQGVDTNDPKIKLWATLAEALMGFPRHLSQHPGGFVISEYDLHRLVPIENAAMPGRRVVQWDKNDLDAMGMLKIDILALGMLTVLQRCLQTISQYQGIPFRLQDIPLEDDLTYQMIQQADTVGVFQIESRAQMSMLPRLKPVEFYDLVIQVAIVRPGPIQGGMVHPYLRRRQNKNLIEYPKAELKDTLERTLGVIIFQEQAMQVAMIAAGFSADEADELRRAMAAWQRHGHIHTFRNRLIQGMLRNGYEKEFALALYQQLEGFGEYGFPESHAASFAKLAWCSAWLKCHEPEAFLVALLNSQPMGFYSPNQLIQDARRHGVKVLAIDVCYSHWESTLVANVQGKPSVRLGLNNIKHFSDKAAQAIMIARNERAFDTLQDLVSRTHLTRRDMGLLAGANALASLISQRRHALWQAAQHPSKDLLKHAPINEAVPDLPALSEQEAVYIDYATTGFTLGRHPLSWLRARLRSHRFEAAQELATNYPDRRLARACGLVVQRQRPQTANGTVFVTLEDETGNVNVIVKPHLALKQRQELTMSRLLGIYGVWQRQEGVCHLLASRLVNLDHWLTDLQVSSRDFH